MFGLSFDIVKLILDQCNMQAVRALAMTNKENRALVNRYKQTENYQNSSVFCLLNANSRYLIRMNIPSMDDIPDFRHRSEYLKFKRLGYSSGSHTYDMSYLVVGNYGSSYIPE